MVEEQTENSFAKGLLDTYLGSFAGLFVFLGTPQNPVKIMFGDPILGIVKDDDHVMLFVDEIEQLIVNIADPNGVPKIQNRLAEIFSERFQALDLQAEVDRIKSLKTEYVDLDFDF